PFRTQMSRWLTEAALTSRVSSPGAGTGSGTSTICRASMPPGVETRTAFIFTLYRVSPEDSRPAIRDSVFAIRLYHLTHAASPRREVVPDGGFGHPRPHHGEVVD